MSRLTRVNECGDIYMSDEYKDMDGDDWDAMALKKLVRYEKLEESGKLIELPCSVGDTLYLLDHECSEGMKYNCEIDGIMEGYLCRNCGTYPCTLHPSIQQVEVKNITIMKENEMIIEFIDLRDVMVEDFGTKVFLTREEAQLKLKEMK